MSILDAPWFPGGANAYLLYAFFLNYFRVVQYTLFPTSVAKVKITPDAWRSAWLREVAHLFTRFIRFTMTFRGIVCLWALFLPDNVHKRMICVMTFAMDLYFLYGLAHKPREDSVMKHRKQELPVTIQMTIVSFGLYFLYFWFTYEQDRVDMTYDLSLWSQPQLPNLYFYIAGFVNAFRIFMYTFFQKNVTEVKISPEAWQEASVREVATAYTRLIRVFLVYRLALCIYGTIIPDSTLKRLLCTIMFAYDCYFIYALLNIGQRKKDSAVKHRNRIPPLLITSFIVSVGLIFHFSWFVLNI